MEAAQGDLDLQTYNIATAFKIKPCKSKDVPNCLSIWFTGGTIEVNNPVNNREGWKRIFGGKDVPRQHLTEEAQVLAAKILMGATVTTKMEEDGTMRYQFHRPISKHG
eukprot:12255271-Ditylum_brightwellii.AAC.1